LFNSNQNGRKLGFNTPLRGHDPARPLVALLCSAVKGCTVIDEKSCVWKFVDYFFSIQWTVVELLVRVKDKEW